MMIKKNFKSEKESFKKSESPKKDLIEKEVQTNPGKQKTSYKKA